MPVIPGADLTLLRTDPQFSSLYLIIQQPQYKSGGDWAGYYWSCQINGAPAGTEGDLVASLTVNNGDAAATELVDGMTVFVGTVKGDHDKGIYRVRNNQDVSGATVTLNIGSTSDVIGNVENDDYVVVLDEFRLWTRYPLITEAAGVLSWYKDNNITYAGLGANAAQRMQASLPPVPIMGPHAVAFVDIGGSVDIDFDWRDSYAQYPGATVDDWDAEGLDGGAGWAVLNNSNPGDQTYSNVSGMAGYRVQLEIGTDQNDPPARFRRGVRYVFTMRRPGETQAGDPDNAEPITDFSLDSLSGDYQQGYWRGQITIYDSQASENEIVEGALVVLFADDWYGDTNQSVAPKLGDTADLDDRENIVFVGRIMDGSITQNTETGDVTFEIASAAGVATNRDMYPIPIEDDAAADEWYKCPDLTVDRAAWFYTVWHSTLPLICDWYSGDGSEPIKAMDFLAGDIYGTIDSFLQARIFGRLLCDRFERCSTEQDRQVKAEGSGATMYTLADTDWLEEYTLRDVSESPVSNVQVGALNYTGGAITPYLGRAPGNVNRNIGTTQSNMSMAMADQATLNTLAGRWLAELSNRWPELRMSQGNWRIYDVWPQDYVVVSLVTDRHTFSSDKFIQRGAEIQADTAIGSIFVSPVLEKETGGVDGQTIEIPPEPPAYVPPYIPYYPPGIPSDPVEDGGRRIISTNVGVFVTNNIGATSPYWYAANNGFVTADDLYVWDIKRDPWHWWTSGGTERTLWALSRSGIWKHEDFPYGIWVNVISLAALGVAGMDITAGRVPCKGRMNLSIEVEDRYAAVFYNQLAGVNARQYVIVCNGAVISNLAVLYLTNDGTGYGDVKFAPHSSGNVIYVAGNRAPNHAASSESQLWKTINAGGAWGSIDTINVNFKGDRASISIPYVSAANPDLYILWGRGEGTHPTHGKYRISINAGAAFADLPNTEEGYTKIGTGGNPDYFWLLGYVSTTIASKWTNDRGVTYNALPLLGGLYYFDSSFVTWRNGILQTALVGNGGAMWRWVQGAAAWTEKTGNLAAYSVGDVTQIDRDTMGAA